MNKTNRDLLEVIAAVEAKSPKLKKIIADIKAGWNGHTAYKYDEITRRSSQKEDI